MDQTAFFLAAQFKRSQSNFQIGRLQLNAAHSLLDLALALNHKPRVPSLLRHMPETRKLARAYDMAAQTVAKRLIDQALLKLVPGQEDFWRNSGRMKIELRPITPHIPLVGSAALRKIQSLDADHRALTMEQSRVLPQPHQRIEPEMKNENSPSPSAFDVEVCRTGYGFATIEIQAGSEAEAQQAALDIAGNFSYSEKTSEYSLVNPVDARVESASAPGALLLDATSKATILAALTHYLRSGQGEPHRRTQEIHDLAVGSDDSVISLDEKGLRELIAQVNQVSFDGATEPERIDVRGCQLPFMTEVAGHILVHHPRTGVPLSDRWTGVCVSSRNANSFWYVGRDASERSFKKLGATEVFDALKEGVMAAAAENSSDEPIDHVRQRQS